MGEITCTVESCESPRRGPKTPYCQMHYSRARRGQALDGPAKHRPPNLSGRCTVEGCTRKPSGYMCGTHRSRAKKYGDPLIYFPPGFAHPKGSQNPKWTGDKATYGTVHHRLHSLKVRPESCAHCGIEGRPIQWALDWGRVVDVKYSQVRRRGKVEQMPFSVDLDDYIGLCLKCHRAFDLRHSGAARKADSHA